AAEAAETAAAAAGRGTAPTARPARPSGHAARPAGAARPCAAGRRAAWPRTAAPAAAAAAEARRIELRRPENAVARIELADDLAGHFLRGAVRRRRVEHRSAVLEHGLEHAADGVEVLALSDGAERGRAAEPDDGQLLVRLRNRLRDERDGRLGAQQARLERQG